MDTFKVMTGLSGDPNYYVVKIYGDGTTPPLIMANCGTSSARANTVRDALIASS